MGRNAFETIMGGVVLLVAAVFISIAYKSGNVAASTNGYNLTAKFEKIDGLSIGSDVRLSGMKIGSVIKQKIDPQTYYAIVTITINKDIKLPRDSSAQISSDGLLGGKYLSLTPGAEEDILHNNDEIKYTQSSVNLEELIAKAIFGSADKKGEDSDKPAEDNKASTPGSAL